MEVILLDDVVNLGHEGDVVEVADGYGRNYLIPQQLAVRATKGNRKELDQRRRAIQDREEHKCAQAQELAEKLKEESIVIRASVGEGGRLHGEITPQAIAEAVADQHAVQISRHDIDIPTPIREKGNYLISATLYKEVSAELPVKVIGLEEELSETEAETVVEEAEAAAPREAAEVSAGEQITTD